MVDLTDLSSEAVPFMQWSPLFSLPHLFPGQTDGFIFHLCYCLPFSLWDSINEFNQKKFDAGQLGWLGIRPGNATVDQFGLFLRKAAGSGESLSFSKRHIVFFKASRATHWLSLVAESRGYSLVAESRGYSLAAVCRRLMAVTFLAEERGLSSYGTWT